MIITNRHFLRMLIDKAWQEATDSEQVPSTSLADKIIDEMVKDFNSVKQNSNT